MMPIVLALIDFFYGATAFGFWGGALIGALLLVIGYAAPVPPGERSERSAGPIR
jgi:hypothetical protein